MEKVLKKLTSLAVLLDTAQQARLNLSNNGFTVSPTKIFEVFMEFAQLILEEGTYAVNVENGANVGLKLDFAAEVIGEGGEINWEVLQLDHTLSYTGERGSLTGGRRFVLEDYSAMSGLMALPPISDTKQTLFDAVTGAANQEAVKTWVRGKIGQGTKTPDSQGNGGTIKSKATLVKSAELRIGNAADYNAVQGLTSSLFIDVAGPLVPAPYAPNDIQGQAGKPHYGVGGFHDFYPAATTLSQPATLVLDYSDSEVAGLDEASMRMYHWDEDLADWTLVGGTLDAALNTVTATVTQMGMYTLAPAMPAGQISWTVSGVSAAGEKTTATLVSGPLVRNDGSLVPAGTIVHVTLASPSEFSSDGPVPFGLILTADAQPEVDGVQAAVGADGTLTLEIEVPGTPEEVRIYGFADLGTAMCDVNVRLIQP